MSASEIEIRPVHTIEEYYQAEEVQRLAWNMPDSAEVVPLHLLITVQKNEGLVLGAWDGEQMVGFLFGFMGRTADGRLKHCSHQMATLPAYRSRGVGQRLKWCQREFVLQQGLDLVTWTYDPLETVNGYLNIAKLGAVCRTYLRNVYGDLRDSLNRGLPTDRFQVDWWLQSAHVTARHDEHPIAPVSLDAVLASSGQIANPVQFVAGLPEPDHWQLVEAPQVLVEVPAAFQQVKVQSLDLAQAWRMATRAIFESYFKAGYSATNVVRHEEGGTRRCFYLLQPNVSSE